MSWKRTLSLLTLLAAGCDDETLTVLATPLYVLLYFWYPIAWIGSASLMALVTHRLAVQFSRRPWVYTAAAAAASPIALCVAITINELAGRTGNNDTIGLVLNFTPAPAVALVTWAIARHRRPLKR